MQERRMNEKDATRLHTEVKELLDQGVS